MNPSIRSILTSILVLLPILSFANEAASYDRISLQAMATQEVANDVLVATLLVQENGANPAILANKVNIKMAQLLDKTTKHKGIDAHTTGYNSRPFHKNGNIKSWQVSQHITLTSQDFEQLSKLIAELNSLATIQSMSFRVSVQLAKATKAILLKQAIANFRSKASLIAQQFDKPNYRLVHVNIDRNQTGPSYRMERTMMMADVASSAPPALSAGTNKIQVNVNGTIELMADN
ncbi:MAG: SIMPL domain-containing protein [Piscirickettsiaceae bacterium]|nr:SIMPL domain-containing protein [Piscirickettsiaceae bacterium]